MNNELMLYMQGAAPVRKPDRQVAAAAKRAYDEVRIKTFQADGAMAMAGHMQEGLADLIRHRRQVAGDDPEINAVLSQIEMNTVHVCRRIQTDLFKQWSL